MYLYTEWQPLRPTEHHNELRHEGSRATGKSKKSFKYSLWTNYPNPLNFRVDLI